MVWFLIALAVVIVVPFAIEYRRQPMTQTLRAQAPGRFADLTRGVTHYQWSGPMKGRHIVCIHGLTTPSYVWNTLLKGFTLMGFRVLTYDLYGRGYSARPKGPQDPLFFRQQLAELLEDQEVDDPVILVGYSMGGAIAVDYASTHPQKVERLILLATAGLGATLSPFVRFMINVPIIGDGLMYTFGGTLFGQSAHATEAGSSKEHDHPPPPLEQRHTRGFMAAVLSGYRDMLSIDQLEAHRMLAENGIPVLAIWAAEDDAIPLSSMGRLAEVNRAAYQDVIKGADHRLPMTNAQEIIGPVQEFLRDVA